MTEWGHLTSIKIGNWRLSNDHILTNILSIDSRFFAFTFAEISRTCLYKLYFCDTSCAGTEEWKWWIKPFWVTRPMLTFIRASHRKNKKITPPKQKWKAEISGNLLVLNIIWILNDFGYKIRGKTSTWGVFVFKNWRLSAYFAPKVVQNPVYLIPINCLRSQLSVICFGGVIFYFFGEMHV